MPSSHLLVVKEGRRFPLDVTKREQKILSVLLLASVEKSPFYVILFASGDKSFPPLLPSEGRHRFCPSVGHRGVEDTRLAEEEGGGERETEYITMYFHCFAHCNELVFKDATSVRFKKKLIKTRWTTR